MNIGIYGGTFDPPHVGHVTAAKAAMEVLGLDKLVLVPDAQPPHKALPEGGAAPRQRYDMAVLATAALGKRAEVSDMELRRSGVSYTADTLAALREQYPDDTLYLLMGSDMFLSLHNWRRPEAIMAMAHIAPFSREAEDESAAFAAQSARLEREFGAQVTVVEGQDRLLPMPSMDADVSTLLQREMKKRRIACELGRTLKDVRVEDGVVRATLTASPFVDKPTPAQQKEVPVEADMVLVTVGRCPATEGLGLAEAGIGTDRRGWVVVDDALKTSLPEVYAIGDLLGPSRVMLAHVAAMEGLCVVESLCGKPRAMRYDAVPSGVFTSPEVGSVGLSEQQAREQGLDVRCVTFQMRELGKAQAMGELPGFFKLVAAADGGRLLGAHIVGAHASDLVAEAALGVANGLTLEQVAHTIHAHPTLAEGLYEAVLLAQEA